MVCVPLDYYSWLCWLIEIGVCQHGDVSLSAEAEHCPGVLFFLLSCLHSPEFSDSNVLFFCLLMPWCECAYFSGLLAVQM